MFCSCSWETTGPSLTVACICYFCFAPLLSSNKHLVWGKAALLPHSALPSIRAGAGEISHFVGTLLLTNVSSQGRVVMHRHSETNMLVFFPGESPDCRATPHWLVSQRETTGSKMFFLLQHSYLSLFAAISCQNII